MTEISSSGGLPASRQCIPSPYAPTKEILIGHVSVPYRLRMFDKVTGRSYGSFLVSAFHLGGHLRIELPAHQD